MPGNIPHPQSVLRGHRGEVQALDFDGSERVLVSGDSLGEVRVWDLEDLRPAAIRRLHPLTGGILSLRLFKTGGQQVLGTQGRDGTTLLWDCDGSMQLSEHPVRSFVRDCYSFCRFSVLAGEPLDGTAQPSGCAAAPRAPQAEQQAAEEALADEFLAAVLADDVEAAASPPGTHAAGAAAGEPGGASVAAQQDQDASSGPTSDPQAAAAAIWALHPCGEASSQHPPALLAIPGGGERIAEVVCCSCGQQVAAFVEQASGRKLGMLMAVQLYAPSQPPAPPGGAAPPPPRIFLAAGYEDGSVVVWRLGDPPLAPPVAQRVLCRDPVMALAIDSARAGGVAGSAEHQLVAFKLDHAAGKISVRHATELQRKGIGDVVVRPDRRLLATAGWDGRVRLYKYRSGRPLAVLKYHTSAVTGLCFAPRSMLLATAARDGTLALWPLFQPEQ